MSAGAARRSWVHDASASDRVICERCATEAVQQVSGRSCLASGQRGVVGAAALQDDDRVLLLEPVLAVGVAGPAAAGLGALPGDQDPLAAAQVLGLRRP